MRTASDNTARKDDAQPQLGAGAELAAPAKLSAPLRYRLNALRMFFLFCLYLLILAPIIQLTLQPVSRLGLHGMWAPQEPPPFKLKKALDGSFQKKAELWFLRDNGLWEYLVRASNELTYRVFGQLSGNYGSTLLVGKEEQLYQPMYLKSFNKVDVPSFESIEQRVIDLKELQDLLQQRGIATTLFISSNSLYMYPELIPSAYSDPGRTDRKNSYEIFRPLLDKHNVKYVDGHEVLSELKADYPFRFFQSTASHWNDVAACIVTDRLLKNIGPIKGHSYEGLNCQPVVTEPLPRQPDLDLLEIANVLYPKQLYRPAPYVEIPQGPINDPAKMPKVLFVGTSFSFSILSTLKKWGIIDDHRLYFYYNQVHDKAGSQYLIKWKIDWEKEVFANDLIVIETNVANTGIAGFDFLRDALKRLRKSSKQKS